MVQVKGKREMVEYGVEGKEGPGERKVISLFFKKEDTLLR